jgi:hypothetical protein
MKFSEFANKSINETATAGGTGSGAIASAPMPAVKRKIGKSKNGLPQARQATNPDGTAKNALDMTTNIFGGP